MLSIESGLLILKKWRDEKNLLFCRTRLFCGVDAVFVRATVLSADDEWVVIGDSVGSELLLRVPDMEAFEYIESKDAPVPTEPPTVLLAVFFRLPAGAPVPSKRDALYLAERPD